MSTSPAAVTIPGYSDFEHVAHGSTAFVYRAVQERLDRKVAIKVLLVDDEMTTADSVEKELEATVAVSNHPHIVSIIDTGTSEAGQPYIVMEYCDGGSYSQILKADGPLSVDDVIEVGVKIGQALQAAHNADILHRDVKPQNILRAQYGPALADFGIARTPAALAATAAIDKLTPLHASPEALLRQPQTASSDLFSLASSMWHLLAGFAPFANPEGGTDPDTHRQRVTSETPPPKIPRDDVPEWLEGLLVRALSLDPTQRAASCQAFADELQRNMYGQGTPSGVGTAQAPAKITDLSAEETVFRPDGPPAGPRAPLDPFAPVVPGPGGNAPAPDGIPLGETQKYAGQPPPSPDSAYTLGSGLTGGGTQHPQSGAGYAAHLGPADPGYLALGGQAPASAPPISGMPHSAAPHSAAPFSAPPQAPVSMQPPSMPWAQQQAQAAPTAPPQPQAQQQGGFPAPVISRDTRQAPQRPPKLPKAKDDRGLRPYVVLGVVITAVLGLVMAGWLWIISPDETGGGEDTVDPTEIEGEGAPQNLVIVTWLDGNAALSWEPPPVEDPAFSYQVFSQRVGDERAEPVNPAGTTDTEYTVSGLNPDEEYCFTVGALWAADSLPMSDPVCTNDAE